MKKIGLYLTGLCLSVVFLTSCMKGSNVWEGYVFGVVGLSDKNFVPVIKTSIGDLYASSLMTSIGSGQINLDDCYWFYIRLDSDLPENSSSAIEAYGYQTISILDLGKIDKYNVIATSFLDTSSIRLNETPIVKAYDNNNLDYIVGYFFMGQLVNIPDDWKLEWDMSFNPEAMPTVENGKNYYDVFVRATVAQQSAKTDKKDVLCLNAYNMRYFFNSAANKERSLLGNAYSENVSKFTVRFIFPSKIDETNNSITWDNNQLELFVASFLSVGSY